MTKRQVNLHDEWRTSGSLQVLGRCLDLANAYKQFAVSPSSLAHSAIAVPNMEGGEPDIYFTRVLPFGATASVYHFLRIAETLKLILRRKLGLIMCCYFDDYPCATYRSLSSLSQFAAEKALDLLGVRISQKPHKRLPFDECFSVLGVQIRFPSDYLNASAIKVLNTLDRQQEINDIIKDTLDKGTLSPAEASSLAGRLNFLSSQAWSRAGVLLTAYIRARADDRTANSKLDDNLLDSLQAALTLIQSPPRHVRVNHPHATCWIFSDAAVTVDENNKTNITIGGVLLDEDAKPAMYFSEIVPETVTALWEDVVQPVTYAESLGALIAKKLWGRYLIGKDVILGIDNIAAQQTLIRGSSRSEHLRGVLRCHMLEDRVWDLKVWYTWVPSESNVADKPSRMRCSELDEYSCVRMPVNREIWEEIVHRATSSCTTVADMLRRLET